MHAKKKDSNKLLRALARTLINKHGEWKEFYGWDWFSNSQNDQNIPLEIFARVIRQAQTTCNESNICILKKEYANFEGNKSAGNVSVSDFNFVLILVEAKWWSGVADVNSLWLKSWKMSSLVWLQFDGCLQNGEAETSLSSYTSRCLKLQSC